MAGGDGRVRAKAPDTVLELVASIRAAAGESGGKLAEVVAETVREGIASGDIPPGTPLPSERELMEIIGVSRSIVREALRLLERDGLVTIQMGRGGGAVAQKPPSSAISRPLATLLRFEGANTAAVLEARVVVEEAAAALAVERATPEDIVRLESVATAECCATGDAATALGMEFHRVIVSASKNPVLLVFFELLTDILISSTRNSPLGHSERTETRHAHARIAEALRARRPDDIRRRIRKHLEAYERIALPQQLGAPAPSTSKQPQPPVE